MIVSADLVLLPPEIYRSILALARLFSLGSVVVNPWRTMQRTHDLAVAFFSSLPFGGWIDWGLFDQPTPNLIMFGQRSYTACTDVLQIVAKISWERID